MRMEILTEEELEEWEKIHQYGNPNPSIVHPSSPYILKRTKDSPSNKFLERTRYAIELSGTAPKILPRNKNNH